jgi:AraC family transcriptional regulator
MNAQGVKRNRNLPVVFKRQATWEGIRIEHYRLRGGDLPEHRHRQHHMIMPVGAGCNGELRTANGFCLRGSQNVGAVCVIPAGLAHQARLDGIAEYLAVSLDPVVVERAAEMAHLPAQLEIIEKYSETDAVISNVGMALLAEVESNKLGGQLYADSLANLLAVHLLRNYTVSGIELSHRVGGLSGRTLTEVTDFMVENCARDLHLEELARMAGVSRFHFAREFKRMTGVPPHQYLVKLRIQRAKSLLEGTTMPLSEVGLQSGFSHQSHFSRLFRRFTGTTPQSYRLLFQQ